MVVILWYMYMPAVAYRMMYPVEPGRMVLLETVSVLVWVGGWGCSNWGLRLFGLGIKTVQMGWFLLSSHS